MMTNNIFISTCIHKTIDTLNQTFLFARHCDSAVITMLQCHKVKYLLRKNMFKLCLKIVLINTNTHTQKGVKILKECSRHLYLQTGSLSVDQLYCCYKQRDNSYVDGFDLEALRLLISLNLCIVFFIPLRHKHVEL